MEDALYDMYVIREYAGIEEDRIPDETTILNFRHLLEHHDLGKKLFRTINKQLMEKGLMMREGTIVDATFMEATSSTKNKDGKRDSEMSSGKKGNTWHFGMKMHTGVDAENGLVHSLELTGANENDITQASKLLHGKEESIHGDAGYIGLENRCEMQGKLLSYYIVERPEKKKQHAKGSISDQIQ